MFYTLGLSNTGKLCKDDRQKKAQMIEIMMNNFSFYKQVNLNEWNDVLCTDTNDDLSRQPLITKN